MKFSLHLILKKLAKSYDALHDSPTVEMYKSDLSMENASPADIPYLE